MGNVQSVFESSGVNVKYDENKFRLHGTLTQLLQAKSVLEGIQLSSTFPESTNLPKIQFDQHKDAIVRLEPEEREREGKMAAPNSIRHCIHFWCN